MALVSLVESGITARDEACGRDVTCLQKCRDVLAALWQKRHVPAKVSRRFKIDQKVLHVEPRKVERRQRV